ncbi:Secreted lipase [Cladobotryum mycophilum]|uniref:Carboxylic ester hydrolase n=1 Tax=Cladobotryum mycophilum TaxID=491253 RepID=A0ABR0SPK3_9HYPO
MKPFFSAPLSTALLAAYSITATANPSVVDSKHNVTYRGIHRNGIEVFLNVPYGQDTGGENRFKPPRAYVPERGSIIHADVFGPACPQVVDDMATISEDCLNLNIARPSQTSSRDRLPVMVFIYGGGFWFGSNADSSTDGLVLESIQNDLPIIYVAINYRLGIFGFAQSEALESEGSENAGIRDQRLALEWVRDNIGQFGGDPAQVTIFGQSSGGLGVGLQIMAYGGTKPVPFHQAICESQALEPGITGNFTSDAMQAVIDHVGCEKSSWQSQGTVDCLRGLDMKSLLSASVATYNGDVNFGDIWLPVVDGDFLPAAPSKLIQEHRFAHVKTAMGWCQDDTEAFIDPKVKTAADTRKFVESYVPTVSSGNMDNLLSLYPSSEFHDNAAAGFSGEFYRTSRIIRDILMTCQPIYYAQHISAAGNSVYLYDWNQTIRNRPGRGPEHGSELPYVFGKLNSSDPAPDYKLMQRASRSWSTFASTGAFSLDGHDTFTHFTEAFRVKDNIDLFVAGGPTEGMSLIDGPEATDAVSTQQLRERCDFINSPSMIKEIGY